MRYNIRSNGEEGCSDSGAFCRRDCPFVSLGAERGAATINRITGLIGTVLRIRKKCSFRKLMKQTSR